jgi:hypothetical protein
MPKLTIPERTFIVEKYFEAKSVVAVLRQFQIAFPGPVIFIERLA